MNRVAKYVGHKMFGYSRKVNKKERERVANDMVQKYPMPGTKEISCTSSRYSIIFMERTYRYYTCNYQPVHIDFLLHAYAYIGSNWCFEEE